MITELRQTPKVKISIDLYENVYNQLVELKQNTHVSVGKLINQLLSENLNDIVITEEK